MVFICFTLSSCAYVLAMTITSLVNVIRPCYTDGFTCQDDLTYDVLGLSAYESHWILLPVIIVIMLTGFFVIPIGLLTYVQIKNFLSNRTTNERLTNKVYKRRKLKPSAVGDADSEHSGKRGGSMASSVFTTTTSLLAEDVVMDLGSPMDFDDRYCQPCLNVKEMCHSRKIPDQSKLFE